MEANSAGNTALHFAAAGGVFSKGSGRGRESLPYGDSPYKLGGPYCIGVKLVP